MPLDTIQTLIVVSDSPEPILDQTLALPALDPPFQYVRARNLDEIAVLLLQDNHIVILVRVSTLEHIKTLLSFTREYKTQLRTRKLALMVLNSIEHAQVPELLTKMGVEEVLFMRSARARSIKTRIDRKFKELLLLSDPSITERRVELMKALDINGDCWLFRGPDDARKTGESWVIDLLGPGPNLGRWTRLDAKPTLDLGPLHALWLWKTLDPNRLGGIPGAWIFTGQRPQFRDYHWNFISQSPQLTYFLGDQAVANRFVERPEEGLIISSNSSAALERWGEMRASILEEYHLEPDAEIPFNPFEITSTRTDGTAWRDFLALNEKEEEAQQGLFHQIERNLAANSELFLKVKDAEVRQSYLRELSLDQHVAIVWSKGQKLKLSAQIDSVDPNTGSITLRMPPGLKPADLMLAMSSSKVDRFYINISLRRASLFFVVPIKQWRATEEILSITIPELLYEVQRRSHFRMELPNRPGLFAEIDGKRYQITNLSAGGIALTSKNPDPNDMRRGQKIYLLSFVLNSDQINCTGEVRWSRPATDKESATIGIQFKGLPAEDEQRINLYVLEESFDYLARALGPTLIGS